MEQLEDILLITVPGLLVFLSCYLLVKRYFESNVDRQIKELKAETQKTLLPLRLQAYERVVLYLERISPNSIVMRVYKPGMSSKLLQMELTRTIREEYEHNMTQQIYVSVNAWTLLKNAKEETIRLINISSAQISPDASGLELSQMIFENSAKLEKLPSDIAIGFAKAEVHKFFN